MFMLRLDELTIALHECDGSYIEASSYSTARPTSPPAHRHNAVIASASPAHCPRRQHSDSKREPPASHQHIATHGDSTVTANAASTSSPAHRHGDSTVTAQRQWQYFHSIQRMN